MLKKAMNDKWEKLLQLSMPKEGHWASSTGILEDTNPNRSILDLGIKSPRVAAPPTNAGPGEVTRLNPAHPPVQHPIGKDPGQQATMGPQKALEAVWKRSAYTVTMTSQQDREMRAVECN